MFPVLLRIGSWSVSTLGFLLVLGALGGLLWSLRRAPKYGISSRVILDVTLIAGLSFVVGARGQYVAMHWAEYEGHWSSAINVFQGGTAAYGGILLSLAAVAVYARITRVPFAKLGAILTPPFFVAMATTRVGCFANGCCFGKPTHSVLGVHFPYWSQAGRVARQLLTSAAGNTGSSNLSWLSTSPAIHPSQLYSSVGALVCLALVLWAERRRWSAGMIAGLSLALLGTLRFTVDQSRYYGTSDKLAGMPINSWISVVVFLDGLVWLIWETRRQRMARTRSADVRVVPTTGGAQPCAE